MSDITIYHNPACGTSRNVLGLIRNSGAEPRIVEYLKTPPDRATLGALIAAMGIPARELLRQVGLQERMGHRPAELSGGQQQRAAIARALVLRPAILLADEPTGNLDSKSAADVLRLIDDVHANGQTVVMVTHDNDIAARAPRQVRLRDGRIEHDLRQHDLRQHAH